MTPTSAERPPPPDYAGDHELRERAAAGDLVAFEAIMRRHNRVLYRTARSILRSDAEAEETVQEGYLRAYRALSGFRGESSLATWLTRIVINEGLGPVRKRRAEGEIGLGGEVRPSGGVERRPGGRNDRRRQRDRLRDAYRRDIQG